MSSSTSGFPPVAKLCSNCRKAQFRDDIPQLLQHGSELEFDERYLPPDKSGKFGFRNFGTIPTEFEFVDWFPELPNLIKSGRDGCDFCWFLHRAITFASSKSQDTNRARIMFVTISYAWGPYRAKGVFGEDFYGIPPGLSTMRITIHLSGDKMDSESAFTLDCGVQCLNDSDDAISQWLGLGNFAYPSYCDEDSICWMSHSLESCRQEHDHVSFDQTYVPQRLIDVSLETPRLVLRNDALQSGRSCGLEYAALSYCWGSGESQTMTTADTLHLRQQGITESEMSPVLRDAIRVTRALNLSFLWIDALCILQDNKSDWEQQCSEMHNIYGSAQVTICVANSHSSNEGFLQQTGPRVRLPFQSHRSPDTPSSFLVQYGGRLSSGPSFETWEFQCRDLAESPWMTRGWVFQEEKLSIRKLIFGPCNVYFECADLQDARGIGIPTEENGRHLSKFLAKRDPRDIYDIWERSILHKYSKYDASTFSYAADVLPALSGLARLFSNRLKDVYYAGHWERDLYRSLSWSASTRSSQPLRPDGLVIPSWSRLAKGDTETYAYSYSSTWRDVRSEIKVSKSRVVTVGDDPFGALKVCSLRIRGYTLALDRREVQISSKPMRTFLGRWHLVLDGRCFGHLEFDWKAGLHDPKVNCPSEKDVKLLKILLLGSFITGPTSEEVSEDAESVCSCTQDDENSELEYKSGDESESQDQIQGFCEWCHTHGPAPNEEASTCDGDSEHRRFQIPIRQGYGLIISPTGKSGEFCRVGVVFDPFACMLGGDGNLEALQGLAQMETVHLV